MAISIRHRVSRNLWIVGSLVLVVLIVASSIRGWTDGPQADNRSSLGDDKEKAEEKSADTAAHKFQVTIRRPPGPPLIELKQPDPLGRVGRIACSTCHSIRTPNPKNREPSDLKEFHQDIQFAHGKLACYACHNPSDSDTLRLADGSVVEYADVMTLCAQCHGAQARKYAKGFHGGMTGYWDLSRGGRVRNNCIDCHDSHVPKSPMMQPTFKPRDRFLTSSSYDGHAAHRASDDREADSE